MLTVLDDLNEFNHRTAILSEEPLYYPLGTLPKGYAGNSTWPKKPEKNIVLFGVEVTLRYERAFSITLTGKSRVLAVESESVEATGVIPVKPFSGRVDGFVFSVVVLVEALTVPVERRQPIAVQSELFAPVFVLIEEVVTWGEHCQWLSGPARPLDHAVALARNWKRLNETRFIQFKAERNCFDSLIVCIIQRVNLGRAERYWYLNADNT